MIETLISSSVLILVIIAVRAAFKGRISSRIRYALWLIAAVRLMLPVSLVQCGISVMNIANGFLPATVREEALSDTVEYPPYIPEEAAVQTEDSREYHGRETVHIAEPAAENSEISAQREEYRPFSWYEVINSIRIYITVLMLIWFAAVNIIYSVTLRKARKEFLYDCPLKIYTVSELSSPCIFGFFSPAVYIPESSSDDSEAVEYIVAHELCHYYHGDMLWTVLRYVLLAFYWFDPFVWAAAMLSKRDCECSCDEAAIKMLGEERRFKYGKAIIDLIPQRRGESFGVVSTSMASGKEALKERMKLIASKPESKRSAVIALSLIIFIAAGATFTSAQSIVEDTSQTDVSESELATPAPEETETAEKENNISISVRDFTGEEKQLIYFPAPEGYEPYIYMDEYTPALTGEAYFGDRLADFIEKSHFSSADIICSDSFAKITADKNRDDFDMLTASAADIVPEYISEYELGEPCAQIIFGRANGGFSSALKLDFFKTEDRIIAKMTGDDLSALTGLLLAESQPPEIGLLVSAYKSSVHFESEPFYADGLYEIIYDLSGEKNRDETENLSYEKFGTDMFSESLAEKFSVTGEMPKGFVEYEYGDIAFGVPYEGNAGEIGSFFLWQNGNADMRLSDGEMTGFEAEEGKNGKFDGRQCTYYESRERAGLEFSDKSGKVYFMSVGFKNDSEKETAMQIFGTLHTADRTEPVYLPPVALSADASIYGDENYDTSVGHGNCREFCADRPGMLAVSFYLTDTSQRYETDFDCYIEKKEPDGKWYRVIPLGELIQENSGYHHFYTEEESGRIPACLDLSCYPLLPSGQYRLVKPYRTEGGSGNDRAALYDFVMSGSLEPENKLLCTAECTEKEISSDAKYISYNVTSSKVMFVMSENADIEREDNGVWTSVRKSAIHTNSLHAGFPLAFSGEYKLSTSDFVISRSGKYRIRLSYGNCDGAELEVSGNGYGTAYAEFIVT